MANQVRPATLDDIIGQQRLVNTCKTIMKSAEVRGAAMPHVLFTGPAGMGKTTFARALANDFNKKIILANAASIQSVKVMRSYLMQLTPSSILFVDEIHAWPMSVNEFMYTVMEDFRYDYMETFNRPKGVGIGNTVEFCDSYDLPQFTLIGATTVLGKIPPPLRRRFKYIEEFKTYSIDDLTKVVHRIAAIYGFKLTDAVAVIIAKTCKGNPSLVVNRTEWLRDYMLANNIRNLSQQKLKEIIIESGVDLNGLTELDRKYIARIRSDGVAGLATLTSALNTDRQTILEDIEPYLIRIGLVGIASNGRYLVAEVYNKLMKGELHV